jgi:hypothetical protein
VSQSRRHAAPRPARRRAPRLELLRSLWVRRSADPRPTALGVEAPASHRARTPKADPPRPPRERRAPRQEPAAALLIAEFGTDERAIHLPGVFRLDAGRRGGPPRAEDLPPPTALLEPGDAPLLRPGIPHQHSRSPVAADRSADEGDQSRTTSSGVGELDSVLAPMPSWPSKL